MTGTGLVVGLRRHLRRALRFDPPGRPFRDFLDVHLVVTRTNPIILDTCVDQL